MKQVDLDEIQLKDDVGINNINQDHKAIFNYIEKLQDIEKHPKDHKYAIIILESFIAFFFRACDQRRAAITATPTR